MKKNLASIVFAFACLPLMGISQGYRLENGKKFQKVKFELVSNLVVIPIEVNGSKLSFVLDSGVSNPILFNLTHQDSIQINKVSEISIQGLGNGAPIKALSSQNNLFRLGNAVNGAQHLYVVLDKDINFSPSLGISVHGIIGYDLFRDFVVDINYTTKTIKLYDPDFHTYKKNDSGETLYLDVSKKKAYVQGEVLIEEDESIPVKMLVDTGSSDAVWLFENDRIDIPERNYDDFLGKGLSGNIFGKRTIIKHIKIGSFVLYDTKTAFPHRASFGDIENFGNRNGSMGGEILKRFNIVLDYPNNKITFRKNSNFGKPFHYNMSGIELQHDGLRYVSERITDSRGAVQKDDESFGNVQILFGNTTRLSLVPEIVVSAIRAGSPAESAGLKEGDVILAVNGKSVHSYKLQEIMQMLNEKEGRKIRVLIERLNSNLIFSFVLKNLLKEKP